MTAASIDRAALEEALTWVSKAAARNPAVPVLAGVLITATQGPDMGITLSCFDYEVAHSAHLDAMVTEPGQVLVPAQLAAQMVSSLKGDTVHLEPGSTGWGLSVKAGRTVFQLPELPLGDFPTLPTDPDTVGEIPAAILAALVETVEHAAGRDNMLPVLTGIHLTGSTGSDPVMTAEATDRFRAARRRNGWRPARGAPEFTSLVPGRRLVAAVSGLNGTVELGHSDSAIRLTTSDRTVVLRVLEGAFPKLNALFPDPDACATTVVVETAALRAALTRASLALEGNESAGLRVTGDTVEVLVAIAGGSKAAAADAVDARVEGTASATSPFETGFNPRFLSDSLAQLGRYALLGFGSTAGKPALLIPAGDTPDGDPTHLPDVTCLCMPRRVL